MEYNKRFYVVSLPCAVDPKELHIWIREEVQLCCGDIKIHFASDNENECTEFINGEVKK